MLDRFSQYLDQNVLEPHAGNLFTYRELKCQCKSTQLRKMLDGESTGRQRGLAMIGQKNLSLGEVFI